MGMAATSDRPEVCDSSSRIVIPRPGDGVVRQVAADLIIERQFAPLREAEVIA